MLCFKKNISLCLIVVMVAQLSGCVKRVSMDVQSLERNKVYSEKKIKYVARLNTDHFTRKVRLTSFEIEDDQFIGDQIYPIRAKLQVPLRDIQTLEKTEFSPGKTVLAVLGIGAGVFVVLLAIVAASFADGFEVD